MRHGRLIDVPTAIYFPGDKALLSLGFGFISTDASHQINWSVVFLDIQLIGFLYKECLLNNSGHLQITPPGLVLGLAVLVQMTSDESYLRISIWILQEPRNKQKRHFNCPSMGAESEHCALQILSAAGILCLVLLHFFILFGFHSCLEEGKRWYSGSNETWPLRAKERR